MKQRKSSPKFLGAILKHAGFEIAVKSILVVLSLVLAALVSHFPAISPTVCAVVQLASDIPCQSIGPGKALQYSNVYKIESFEDHFPGATSATAKTEDGTRVWTSFTSINPDKKPPRDHTIYAIVEQKHLEKNSCILLNPGTWPSENIEENANTGWDNTFIVLKTDLLRQDKESENSIMLKPLNAGASDTNVEFYVNGSLGGGLRGVLEESCSAVKENANFSRTQAYSLIDKANAQSRNVSGFDSNNRSSGWAYVGLLYEHRWVVRYFDVDVRLTKENSNGELQHGYKDNSKVVALGNVNLRENHIQFSNGKWVNQEIIGVVCKGKVVNVIELKRVARVADTSEEYDEEKFDGYWWVKVIGNIGSMC